MNYEYIALRRDQLETLDKCCDEIERRFDVEFYVKHGNSLVHLCGSLEGAGEYLNSPTHSLVFIRCRNSESQQNVPLAKAYVASLMKDAAEGEDGDETEDEVPWGSVVPLDVSHMSHVHHKALCGQHSSASVDDEEVHSFSPGPESNHDSCYDTDEDSCSHKSGWRSDAHEDVSRTTSDTLAAEHTDQLDDYDGYVAKKDFAVKLGYTEDLLKSALSKLGKSATQNELLEELISLSSQDGPHHPEKNISHMEDTQQVVAPETNPSKPSTPIPPAPSALEDDDPDGSNLRDVVIDGSNVAMSHGNKEVFSCHGIRLAVNWFKQRGHKEIIVFVPSWRKESPRADAPITDQEVLLELEKEGILKFTPSRRVKGKRVVCYDDRFILKLAAETGGIVVSNDTYKDLLNDSEEFKHVIEERLLMYTFVQDRFMPPDDPQGRHGPTLDNFLRKKPTAPEVLPPDCPYAKKCTFGNKCKYNHPERKNQPHRMVADKLAEQAKSLKASQEGDLDKRHQDGPVKKPLSKTTSLQPTRSASAPMKKALSRTRSLVPGMLTEEPKRMEHPKLAPHLTLTVPTPTDPDKWKSQEELASAFKEKMSVESEGLKSKDSGTGQGQKWMMPRETLRATHSEPYQLFSGGHLALAKKLSDEGRSSPGATYKYGKGSRESSVEGEADDWAKARASPVNSNQHESPQVKNRHTKVVRQLSLKGCEDPRWQQKQAKGRHASPSPSNVPQKTSVFRTKSDNTFTNKGATWTFNPEPARLGPPPMIYNPQLGLILPNMSQPPPRTKMPLTRNESAPDAPSRQMAEHRAVGPPRMTRQNSSSDSQLHVGFGEAMNSSLMNMPPEPTGNPNWPGSFDHVQSLKRQAFHTSYQRGETNNNVAPRDTREQPQQQQQHCLNPGLMYYPPFSRHNIPDSVQQTHGPPTLGPPHGPPPTHGPNQVPPPNPRTLSPPHPSVVPTPGGAAVLNAPHNPPLNPPMNPHMGMQMVGAPPQSRPPSLPSNAEKEKLYYHLCCLFPKEKVEQVMSDNPHVTDAKLLCALIIQMPD